MKPIKVHTILFTEACPLACRYCFLKDSEVYGKDAPLNEEEIFAEIERINKADNPEECYSMLLLTGGEPFLYPELIKKIINTYGKRFIYRFNTSGYLLDKEMIEFLSHYNCDFVLSVDGDENLTNYLRPTRDKAYGVGYMEQFKEIVHTLLFYFPKTPYRIIIGPRYVDKLHEMYLYAETLGFRQFTFILDFESRPSKPIEGKPIWTQDKTEILKAELSKIVAEQIEGFKLGIQRPTVVELTQCLQWLAKSDNSFNPDLYPCRVFDGRTNYTMNAKQPIYCMDNYFSSMDECKEKIISEFNSLDGKCPINPDCSAFAYCANNCCPKNAYDAHGSFFHLEELECALMQAVYPAALSLLKFGLEECNNSLFRNYLKMCGF